MRRQGAEQNNRKIQKKNRRKKLKETEEKQKKETRKKQKKTEYINRRNRERTKPTRNKETRAKVRGIWASLGISLTEERGRKRKDGRRSGALRGELNKGKPLY